MIFQGRAKLIKNITVAQGHYQMSLSSLVIAKDSQPGQFIEIKVADNYEPFLRRPFSIHRVRGSQIEILYEIVGKGTEILSQKNPGEYLDVIGPLGNGYSLLSTGYPLLVAGGMGVAPLIFLAEKLAEIKNPCLAGRQAGKIKNLVLIGAKTKDQILCEKEFQKLGYSVKIATDDGSRGFKGKVTELLENLVQRTAYSVQRRIYACGPRPMLKEISRASKEYNIPAQISLEEHMACGIGACLGCAVNTQEGYKRVCKDGPVFNAGEIVW